jgi:hypothetical protein
MVGTGRRVPVVPKNWHNMTRLAVCHSPARAFGAGIRFAHAAVQDVANDFAGAFDFVS